MANIALCTHDKTHATFTNTKSMLESFGHIVSGYGSGEMFASQLANFDIILCTRMSVGSADINAVAGAVDLGTPVICGSIYNATENTSTTVAVSIAVGIANSQETKGSSILGFYPKKTHPVFSENMIELDVLCTTSTSAAYYFSIRLSELAPGGNVIGNYENTSNSDAVIAIYNKGAMVLNSKTLGADVVFCGFLYGLVTYSQAGAGLINSLIENSIFKRFIRGNVRDSANLPISRKLVAINKSDLSLAGSTFSDPSTGEFEIKVGKVGEGAVYTVICYDDDGGTKNALVKDRVISVE